MTPAQFFSKNLKWITLILGFLFLLKSIQSCNRGSALAMNATKSSYVIDSLTNNCVILQDSIKELNFELKLANKDAKSANEKANAVVNAVSVSKTNTTTTVVVKGDGIVKENK